MANNNSKQVEYNRTYRNTNREEYNAYMREYYHRNKDKWNRNRKRTPPKGITKDPDYKKQYYQKNRDSIIRRAVEHWANYNKAKPIMNRVTSQKYYAVKLKKAKCDNTVNYENILDVLSKQKNKCNVCSLDFDGIDFQIDHIIPLSQNGSHSIKNIQILCERCHNAKTSNERKACKSPAVIRK